MTVLKKFDVNTLWQIIVVFLGTALFLFVVAMPLANIALALIAWFRYHLFGIHSQIIDDLFYRSSRGEFTPPPSRFKAVLVIAVFAVGTLWLIARFLT
ncbi:hypothetical protein [Loktanella sp. Alg231-35]|uniref:hypothetical protein n=1 Tax=Loktanella sp. Alg231-35 TaxID=1922220 RepID=UPI000D5526CB|nr:hypothetical protein [Loktanella sp. Alg231-35]